MIITVTGFGLSEEEGCGNCVQDLTDSLDELIMEIRNSTDLLASVNETQQQILQQEIMESQVASCYIVLTYELHSCIHCLCSVSSFR